MAGDGSAKDAFGMLKKANPALPPPSFSMEDRARMRTVRTTQDAAHQAGLRSERKEVYP